MGPLIVQPVMEIVFVSRAIERILIILGAGLCIYLGYRLLLAMPQNRTGEGKVVLPMGMSIIISRLGPGAFFALFGCVVLVLSLRHALQVQSPEGLPVAVTRTERAANSTGNRIVATSFSYLQAGDPAIFNEFDNLPDDVFRDLYLLNQLPGSLREDVDAALKADIEGLVMRGKLLVIHPHWDASWGSEAEFQEWVLSGMTAAPPENSGKPARLLNYGRSAP